MKTKLALSALLAAFALTACGGKPAEAPAEAPAAEAPAEAAPEAAPADAAAPAEAAPAEPLPLRPRLRPLSNFRQGNH